jgi:integrase
MKRRKDGRWLKVVTIKGEKKYFYSSEKTERAAERDINNQLLQYQFDTERGPRFSVVAHEWIKSCEDSVSPTTYYHYDGMAKKLCAYFESYHLSEIESKHVQSYLSILSKQNYSGKTISNHLSVLKLIYRHGIVHFGFSGNDPTVYVTVPRARSSERRQALTEKEQETVANSIEAPFGFFAFTLLYTGMRRGEAIALKWSDIDFERRLITVERSATFPKNVPVIKLPKTEAGIRKVVLLDCLADELAKRKKKAKGSDYVFTGKEIRHNSWYMRRWREYQKETGLTVTPHQLRHTFATILFEAGIDIKDAQTIMGHADITTTRNIYTHIRSQRMQETANKLNDFISKK